MKYVIGLVIIGFIAGAGYLAFLQVQAEHAVIDDLAACVAAQPETREVSPQVDMPVVMQQEYRVNCGTVDGGAAVDIGVPMDGGTVGIPIKADSFYIAPATGSTVKVRVGSSTVTSTKGFEIGSSGRDGAGLSVDAYSGNIDCISEGAAQQCDVVAARRP